MKVITQFVSQVFPPSSENDCSNRLEFGVMSEKPFRARIMRPVKSSWSKNSPRPSLNSPIIGLLKTPSLLFAQFRLHLLVCGLYKRRPRPSMRPAGPVTFNSRRLALPLQTLLTTEVPSYSTHCFDPVKGCTRRETCVFQVPKLKSKSCCPSRVFCGCGVGELAGDDSWKNCRPTITMQNRRQARKYLFVFITSSADSFIR